MAVHDVMPATGDATHRDQSMLHKVVFPAGVIVAYLLIGILAFWPLYPGTSQRLFGDHSDFPQSVWFLSRVPHALAHGLNPFFSNAIFVPTGVNLPANNRAPYSA